MARMTETRLGASGWSHPQWRTGPTGTVFDAVETNTASAMGSATRRPPVQAMTGFDAHVRPSVETRDGDGSAM
jgi:hypothetical protein